MMYTDSILQSLCSQLGAFDDGDVVQALDETRGNFLPLLVELLDLRYLQHAREPLTHQLEVAEAALVHQVVSDLEEVLQVRDAHLLPTYEPTLSQLQLSLKLAHRCLHLLLGSLQSQPKDWFLALDALVYLEEDGSEEGGAEAVLVPGEMLVDECPLRDAAAVVGGELGVLLTEVGEDGVAFAQLEVAVSDEGDLSERVHGQVLLGAGLVVGDVHGYGVVGNAADLQQALHCARRLTGDVPVQRQTHHLIMASQSQIMASQSQIMASSHHSLLAGTTGSCLNMLTIPGTSPCHCSVSCRTSGTSSTRQNHPFSSGNQSRVSSQSRKLVVSKKQRRSAMVRVLPARKRVLECFSCPSTSPTTRSISFCANCSSLSLMARFRLSPLYTFRKMILKSAGRQTDWQADRNWLTRPRSSLELPQYCASWGCFSQRQTRMALLSASLKAPSVRKGICPRGLMLRYSFERVWLPIRSISCRLCSTFPSSSRHFTARDG